MHRQDRCRSAKRTGEDGRTRRTAPRPQISKEEFETRAAQIVREHDEERLSCKWDLTSGYDFDII